MLIRRDSRDYQKTSKASVIKKIGKWVYTTRNLIDSEYELDQGIIHSMLAVAYGLDNKTRHATTNDHVRAFGIVGPVKKALLLKLSRPAMIQYLYNFPKEKIRTALR